MAAACGTCAICLAELDSVDEAFLDGCFHHFHLQCIERWAAAQQEQAATAGEGGHGSRASLACPLCRRPFESAIYDCHDSAYRRRFFSSSMPRSAAGDASGGTGSLALTAAHRRRRAAYSSPLAEQQRQAWAAQRLSRAQAYRRDVPDFVSRELQALLLQQDVTLVAQHVVGTLHNVTAAAGGPSAAGAAGAAGSVAGAAANGKQLRRPPALRQTPLALPRPGSAGGLQGSNGGSSKASDNGAMPLPEVVARLRAAAAPFLFEQAERFAWEVAAFAAASGCSVAAYDRHVQQGDAAAAGAAGAEARRQLRRRHLHQQQAALAAQQGGSGCCGLAGEDEQQRQLLREKVEAIEGGADWDGVSSGSSEEQRRRRQRSPEAERSDSEGYLGLLLAQGRSRQGLPQAAPDEAGQQAQQAQQAQQQQQQAQQLTEPSERRALLRSAGTSSSTSGSGVSRDRRRRTSRRHHSSRRTRKRQRARGRRSRCRSRSRSRSRGREERSSGSSQGRRRDGSCGSDGHSGGRSSGSSGSSRNGSREACGRQAGGSSHCFRSESPAKCADGTTAGSGGHNGAQLVPAAAVGQAECNRGSGGGEQVELLYVLRQQALQALAQHRGKR